MYGNRFSHTSIGSVSWLQGGLDFLSTMQPETREYRRFKLVLTEVLHGLCILHSRWHMDIEDRLELDSAQLTVDARGRGTARIARASRIELASFTST